jgi:protein SCO1/2
MNVDTSRLLRRWLRALFALALLPLLPACDRVQQAATTAVAPTFKAVDITGAEYAREISLPDADGKPRTLADFAGKVTVVFFGYTQCPDVCPTAMIDLAQVKKLLGADGDRIQGIFVTVDPERDTPEVVGAYVKAFNPSFVALRGTPEQTKATAQHFKVFYSRVAGKTPTTYTIDHTAGSYVFDQQGKVRLFIRHGAKHEDVAADLKKLLG